MNIDLALQPKRRTSVLKFRHTEALSCNDSVETGERTRLGCRGRRPRRPQEAVRTSHRLVTVWHPPPTGEGAGRNTRGRVCSPKPAVWRRLTWKFHAPIESPTPRRVGARGLQRSDHRPCRPGPLTRRSGYEMFGRRAAGLKSGRHRPNSCRPGALPRPFEGVLQIPRELHPFVHVRNRTLSRLNIATAAASASAA
jgi:hypothetical protein